MKAVASSVASINIQHKDANKLKKSQQFALCITDFTRTSQGKGLIKKLLKTAGFLSGMLYGSSAPKMSAYYLKTNKRPASHLE